jgi:hypothetical protein
MPNLAFQIFRLTREEPLTVHHFFLPLWKEYLSYIQRNNRDGHKLLGPVKQLF